MLHSLRRRLEELAAREAAGESLWTPAFSPRARTRIIHAVQRIHGNPINTTASQMFAEARRLILEAEGVFTLTGKTTYLEDFFAYYQTCGDDMFPTVIEALIPAMDTADEVNHQLSTWKGGWAAQLIGEANEIFSQERVGWEIIDGRMVEIHSKELHHAAVEPALRLLHQSKFVSADKAYRDALEELAQGKAGDAITDAGTALQQTLTTLGCEGNQLGDLIRSAKKKGLLGPHDDLLAQAIDKALNWVAADRSQMGDAHQATAASREDAWLIVHIVGAMIVRLASGEKRG